MKKLIITLLILFTLINTALAYTVEVETFTSSFTYEKVVRHSFTEEFLIIYILDSFDNYKVMIKKSNIISVSKLKFQYIIIKF